MKNAEEHLRDLINAIDGFLEYDFEERRNLLYLRLLEAMKFTGQSPSYWYVYNEETIDAAVERGREFLEQLELSKKKQP